MLAFCGKAIKQVIKYFVLKWAVCNCETVKAVTPHGHPQTSLEKNNPCFLCSSEFSVRKAPNAWKNHEDAISFTLQVFTYIASSCSRNQVTLATVSLWSFLCFGRYMPLRGKNKRAAQNCSACLLAQLYCSHFMIPLLYNSDIHCSVIWPDRSLLGQKIHLSKVTFFSGLF